MIPERQIPSGVGFIAIACAVIIDIVELLLDFIVVGVVINRIIDVVAGISYWIFFSHYGVNVLKKNPFGFGATLLIEMIPGLDVLPGWTAFVAMTIAKTKAQKKINEL